MSGATIWANGDLTIAVPVNVVDAMTYLANRCKIRYVLFVLCSLNIHAFSPLKNESKLTVSVSILPDIPPFIGFPSAVQYDSNLLRI